MKALVRYVIDAEFNLNMTLKSHSRAYPQAKLNFEYDPILSYSLTPYQYQNVIEEVCYTENGANITEEREAMRLVPSGVAYSNSTKLELNPYVKIKEPDISENEKVNLETTVTQSSYSCDIKNNLTYFSDIQDLLYESNFDDISFYLENIKTDNIIKVPGQAEAIPTIDGVNYQLWIESLYDSDGNINVNPHSFWWNKDDLQEKYRTTVDFFEIPLINIDLTQYGIETGIGFQDSNNKLHGISAENQKDFGEFLIKYTTSKNKNFRIKKQGLENVIGIAFKFVEINNNTLIVFLLKKEIDGQIKYYYFDHTIVNKIINLFCFIRNDKDISSIKSWSDIIRVGQNTNSQIIFNTPQYKSFSSYDPKIINIQDNSIWKNITKIDKNESSYSIAQNLTENEIATDDIRLHFDDIRIPDDAIVKKIALNIITESNSYKSIYPSIRFQDGFITKDSLSNDLIMHPNQIECYPYYNHNTTYYQNQLNVATQNNITESIKKLKNKIIENTIFDESLQYSMDFLDNPDDYITVMNPYWIELSGFSEDTISANNVQSIQLYIEGYNEGKEVYLTSQLTDNNTFMDKKDVLIPSGYFKKYIQLQYNNKFSLDSIRAKFRFKDLNSNIQIFDTFLDVSFKGKQNVSKPFREVSVIDIEKKKQINIDFIEEDVLGYTLKNGLTTVLSFDDLEIGEYYRIYSVELNIVYEKQNIDFILGQNYNQNDSDNFIAIGGISSNDYLSGMFFDETIMDGAYQPNNILNSSNQGIKLEEAIYQSFVATKDNMTGITIYPNGFVGNPDNNLKISLYENKNNTPSKPIKEVRANGWTKANNKFKNSNVISYNFNVNNLKIGETYWIKIEVENVKEGNYYLLKYLDSIQNNMKMLLLKNNNLINTLGCLQFHINTLDEFRSFKSLPISENRDFVNPKIFIGLNKGVGEIKNLKLLTISQGDSIESEDY